MRELLQQARLPAADRDAAQAVAALSTDAKNALLRAMADALDADAAAILAANAEDLRAAIERCVVNEGLAAGPDRVSLMVSRYLPDVPVAPAPSQLPPRPDQSLWGPGGAAAVLATVPLGQVPEPSDIGNAVAFLASPLAALISGANLVVHGGGEQLAFSEHQRG